MPSTVFLRFDAPDAFSLTPRRLHAAWGRVLELPEGISPERAARLPSIEDDATTWNITLLSPTVFTSHGRHIPGVTPAQLATSLHARWHAWSPETQPPQLHPDELGVLTMQDHTESVRVSLGMPRADRRGRLTARSIRATEGSLRISGVAGATTTRVFSRLMSLARFTNVGSHAAYGMGTLDVVAEP
ncbi:CRISPR system precrRNA processing endoribonuclease RAMP protein Cas6 [Actinomyces sp. 594]|uniref:CRISPR system precrRNA processing endoribonuclease RAMP protein Cas6 n=1 Tax=Actinomyces sp. 594 TaxID=2057793 RepID=UPI001C58C328|nr:CRISPR system precrRNA processing endoribonuclease RAMP protein Cas6 [Actinomyces sp. 594]MBW3068761.1 CRISPR system precrRNA processing endoribonuclease RAMP protein Cas6 [Actinomyces sp. 594]